MQSLLLVYVRPKDSNPWILRNISRSTAEFKMYLPKVPQNIFALLLLATSTTFDRPATWYAEDSVCMGQMILAMPTHEFTAYTASVVSPLAWL